MKQNLNKKEQELDAITKKLSKKELEIEEEKKKVEENSNQRYERLSQISTLDANFENLEKTKKSVKEELTSTISELDATRIKNRKYLKHSQKRIIPETRH